MSFKKGSTYKLGTKTFLIVRVVLETHQKIILVVVNDTDGILLIKDTDLGKVMIENPTKEVKLNKILSEKEVGKTILLSFSLRTRNRLAIAFPFVYGSDLFEYLEDTYISKKKRMSENTLVGIFTGFVEAMAELHANMVAHLDISAENIYICKPMKVGEKMCVKMIDLGQGEYNPKVLKGKRGKEPYMAIEMWEGKEYCPYKADVWSMGIVLMVMILLNFPFDSHNNKHLRNIVKNGVSEIVGFFNAYRVYTYPNWVPRILSLCICPVEKRLPNATALLEKLKEELEK